ncbi:MAG: DsbA family protein [Patescibacteria group bacterium]|jgi:protein-disulfide isomerase
MEEEMTRKQRRELKRQEKLESRSEESKRKSRQKMIVILIVVIGVVGLGWLLTFAGNSSETTTGSVDTIVDPIKGNADATVVIQEYSDFQCPACRSAESVVDSVLTQFGDQVRLEYNDFPLKSIHRNAEAAAIAANCANLQEGKYWDFHNLLFTNQTSWEALGSTELTDTLMTYASQLEMDTEAFQTCIDSKATQNNVDEDIREAARKNINSTPTFFVGDERVVGADAAGLTTAIEKALAQ